MKLRYFTKVFRYFKNLFPLYNFGAIAVESDYSRDKTDLIHDIQRKRALLKILGKKIRIYFFLAGLMGLIMAYNFIGSYFVHTEKRAARHYIEQFNMRLENMNNTDPGFLMENAEIVITLSFIKDGEFEKAALLLSGLKGEDAEWLLALCYIRLEEDDAAKATLQKIIGSKGHYSVSANNVLNKYYK